MIKLKEYTIIEKLEEATALIKSDNHEDFKEGVSLAAKCTALLDSGRAGWVSFGRAWESFMEESNV
jgi:hypothetical protein